MAWCFPLLPGLGPGGLVPPFPGPPYQDCARGLALPPPGLAQELGAQSQNARLKAPHGSGHLTAGEQCHHSATVKFLNELNLGCGQGLEYICAKLYAHNEKQVPCPEKCAVQGPSLGNMYKCTYL